MTRPPAPLVALVALVALAAAAGAAALVAVCELERPEDPHAAPGNASATRPSKNVGRNLIPPGLAVSCQWYESGGYPAGTAAVTGA
jgi:hypothetical protein